MRPVAAIVLMAVLAGCAAPEPGGEPTQTRTDDTAPDISMRWQDDPRPHLLVGREAWREGEHMHLFAHEEGIEGGDFGLTFDWQGQGELAYDPDGGDGAFRFAYVEAVFWAGEAVCAVTAVDGASRLAIASDGTVAGSHGAFDLWFTGAGPSDGGCDGPTRQRHVHGSW